MFYCSINLLEVKKQRNIPAWIFSRMNTLKKRGIAMTPCRVGVGMAVVFLHQVITIIATFPAFLINFYIKKSYYIKAI